MDLTPYPSVSETFKTPPPPKPKPEPSEKAKAIVAEVKRRTAAPCWKLTLQPEGTCGLLDSKVGGLPYWDPALPYPTDSQGNKMTLLAQLNFAQLGTEDPLPRAGMLQFFIGQDDGFGIDFDQPDRQKNFRVVYHPEPDLALTLEQIQALKLPTHVEADLCTPVIREAAFTAEKTVGYMGPGDGRFEALFREAVRAVTGEDIGDKNAYQYFDKADRDYFYDQLSAAGSRRAPTTPCCSSWTRIWRRTGRTWSSGGTAAWGTSSSTGRTCCAGTSAGFCTTGTAVKSTKNKR